MRRLPIIVVFKDERIEQIREVRRRLEEIPRDFKELMKRVLKEDRDRWVEGKSRFETLLTRIAEAREEFRRWYEGNVERMKKELQMLRELFKDDEEILPRVDEWATRLEEIERGFERVEKETAELLDRIFNVRYEELRRFFLYTGEILNAPLRLLAVMSLASELVTLSLEISAFLKGYEAFQDRPIVI